MLYCVGDLTHRHITTLKLKVCVLTIIETKALAFYQT